MESFEYCKEFEGCLNTMHKLLPKYGWKARFDWQPEVTCKPFSLPRLSQIPEFALMSMRYLRYFYLNKVFREKKQPFINGFYQLPCKPIYGVPIGGIGAGAMCRGFRGEFCRTHIIPGMYYYDVMPLSQFIVTVRHSDGSTIFQQVLGHQPTKCQHKFREQCYCEATLHWQWMHDKTADNAYAGLYPQSWTVYRLPIFGYRVVLLCHQLSPIKPHCYVDSCLPVTNFQWSIFNCTEHKLDVSITFTWQQGFGSVDSNIPVMGSVQSESTDDQVSHGVIIMQECPRMSMACGIAAKKVPGVTRTTVLPRFYSGKDKSRAQLPFPSAAEFWQHLLKGGGTSHLEKLIHDDYNDAKYSQYGYCLAVSAQVTVGPYSTSSDDISFALVWHTPLVHFRANEISHKRRYTRWISFDLIEGTKQLLRYTCQRQKAWEREINEWQRPVLENASLPDWYKSALFNELYFMSDGGSIWHDFENYSISTELDELPIKRDIGYFAYLEGHEYRMFNTYDVHYYASWALVKLWPKIQLTIQYDIAHYTKTADNDRQYYIHSNNLKSRSLSNSVPHDIGDPEDEPWKRINAYIMYQTCEWKDLNCKFVLQVYRDWRLLGDLPYLLHMLPICKDVILRSLVWDTDDDGIIDNGGYGDQTYDAWSVTGASAYTGGLWLSCLYGICCMLYEREDDDYEWYNALLLKARASFERKLWNGSYYMYDDSKIERHASVMSDQLNGYWFLKSSGANAYNLYEKSHVEACLKTIYETNVKAICDGKFGAINGMNPNHTKDKSSVQAEEFWTGVNYALAATLILEGQVERGFEVAGNCYKTVWERYGLQYQTPEAYTDDGKFRSLGYMRPLCIWSIQHAFDLIAKQEVEHCDEPSTCHPLSPTLSPVPSALFRLNDIVEE